ncbi:hypothetical protein [Phaffia rhodozyma]|uniref:Uncharacterized protein n=1 Tax=Phaffia rhodozyma TaxID=264483 RepID=A0A0F7SKE2_PHARH|nr:hypothetical protein [Phaffia rhodozyma]
MKDGISNTSSSSADDPEGTAIVASIADKLAALKRRNQRWRSLKPARKQEVVALNGDRGSLYDYLGGVLAIGLESPCRTLRFYKIPSTDGPTEVFSRMFSPGWTIKDFTMDPSQDLLVLIQVYTPSFNGRPLIPRRLSYRLHFFNLTSFAPHPEAKEHVVDWPFTLVESRIRVSPFVSVMDSNVMLDAQSRFRDRAQGGAVIWNWRTGVIVSSLPTSNEDSIQSVAFIGPDLLLTAVCNTSDEAASMELYTFNSAHQPPANEPNPEAPQPIRLAVFELPQMEQPPEIMSIRLDPAPAVGDVVPPFSEGPGRTPMFQADGAERLVVLDLLYNTGERYTLFTLKSTILRALRHHPPLHIIHENAAAERNLSTRLDGSASLKTVAPGDELRSDDDGWVDDETVSPVDYPWEDWSAKARLLHRIPQPDSWVLYVYHLSFVHSVLHFNTTHEEDEDHSVGISARVLDFSPFSVARLKSQGALGHTSSKTIFTDGTDIQVVEERADGDVGRLISKPTVCEAGSVWSQPVWSGHALPYVERSSDIEMQQTSLDDDRLSGLCIDEQRLLWVKRNPNGNLVLDVRFF